MRIGETWEIRNPEDKMNPPLVAIVSFNEERVRFRDKEYEQCFFEEDKRNFIYYYTRQAGQ